MEFMTYAQDVMEKRYSHIIEGRKEDWPAICRRVVWSVIQHCQSVGITVNRYDREGMLHSMLLRKFIPGGRMLAQAGRAYHQTDNCYMMQAEDSREGWGDLAQKCSMMFMSGGGVGIDYSKLRPYGTTLQRSGGIASGPLPLIEMINFIGKAARQGGERRGAIYASLRYDHPDIFDFLQLKVPAKDKVRLDHTNISVRYTPQFLEDIHHSDTANLVYLTNVRHACQYGDPGFQYDWDDQILRNACTEIISNRTYDSCCLASINIARVSDVEELAEIVKYGTMFLLLATEYTHVPCPEVRTVKEQYRRLGLGVMGMGEWFIQRHTPYGVMTDALRQWLSIYKYVSTTTASKYAHEFSMRNPVAVRGIAPTGTISIAGGQTTSGIEPVFHTAYIRTYNTLKEKVYDDGFQQEVVVEPIVAKWVTDGYDVKDIDTAYTLSQSIEGIERRIQFQAQVQEYVDNGISSTVNLPQYTVGIEEKIAPVLLKYLPKLRGITFYPDGAYSNQPVQPIDIADINEHAYLRMYETCKGGVCSA